MQRIVTRFVYPPIPIRTEDWEAFYEGDEPNDAGCMAYGSGSTEAEAIADLIENHPDEDEPHTKDAPSTVDRLQRAIRCERCGLLVPIDKIPTPSRCNDPKCPLNKQEPQP